MRGSGEGSLSEVQSILDLASTRMPGLRRTGGIARIKRWSSGDPEVLMRQQILRIAVLRIAQIFFHDALTS